MAYSKRGADQAEKDVFSKNLTRYMEMRGVTQVDLCNALDVNKATMNGWCRGRCMPAISKVQKIADYLHIGKTDLLYEENEIDVVGNAMFRLTFDEELARYVRRISDATPEQKSKIYEFVDFVLSK